MTVRELNPDHGLNTSPTDVRVFLAGTIDLGASEDWQRSFISHIRAATDTAVTVLNPRRDTWFGTPTLNNPEFAKQVTWEMDALELADIIVMRILGSSESPITMLELGLHARSGKLVVFCDETFYRFGNIAAVCDRYGIMRVPTYDALMSEVLSRVAQYVKHVQATRTVVFCVPFRYG